MSKTIKVTNDDPESGEQITVETWEIRAGINTLVSTSTIASPINAVEFTIAPGQWLIVK